MAREVIQLGSRGDTVEALQEYLVKLELLDTDGIDGDFGGNTDRAVKKFQSLHGLEADGIVGRLTWDKLTEVEPTPIVESDPGGLVTRSQARYIFDAPIAPDHLISLNKSLTLFQINTCDRIKHFLAQIGHESGGLRWFAEIADGSDYEGREDLGNTEPGDGCRFKGVDPLQVTGRQNYSALAKYLEDPRVMEGWEYVAANYAFIPSGFWWHDNQINTLVDAGASCREISARVNGTDPANGLSDRLEYFARAEEVIRDIPIAAVPAIVAAVPAIAIPDPTEWTLDNIVQSAAILPGGNFTWAEATKEGDRMPPNQEILEGIIRIATLAQQARDLIGKPFNVTSWYRDPVSNAAVGGVSDSRHLNGDAIDFWVDGMTGAEIYALLDPWWSGGLGQYAKFPFLCHIDARDYWSRWAN